MINALRTVPSFASVSAPRDWSRLGRHDGARSGSSSTGRREGGLSSGVKDPRFELQSETCPFSGSKLSELRDRSPSYAVPNMDGSTPSRVYCRSHG